MIGKIAFLTGLAVVCIGIIAVLFFLMAHLLMWAWSISLVPLFHLPELQFWPAIGIEVLLAFLGVGTYKGKNL